MSETKETKTEVVDIEEYTGYALLIKECSLPSVLTKDKLTFLASLDHFVLCARKYKSRASQDELTRAHCDEIWTKWNTPDVKNSITICVRMLLSPCPSEKQLLTTKLVHLFLNSIFESGSE